ncbi:hypothetical protein C2G38_2226618 [Gigaspora rosea]|uniref:Protein kinase domain-containing protein n=1 Tax=Gigaspora rosea TaxID=44941 RepID=A0A397TXY0_9GLOM|nr:hypothetical protein C2G38_2226618 [Gigaspora rosea]
MERESPSTLNRIGYNYLLGNGVEKDEHKAFIYYQKSAEMGNADGANNVGYCYDEGIGIEKDEHKAFIYYQKSAEMSNVSGIFNVGCCYEKGIGVEKDENKAFTYIQKSAEMGDSDAMNKLGYFYEKGIGVEKDEYKAFIYYQKSADMGSIDGTNNVGYCYANGIGVEKNEHKAFMFYQRSAEMGNASGIFALGDCYKDGIGIEKDEHKAFIYIQKSTEMGHDKGLNKLGIHLLSEMGHTSGIYNVGNCYLYGIGIEKDEHKAFIYFQKSAEMGNNDAMSQLGYCYRNGIGTKIDIQKANYWFQMERNNSHDMIKSTHENLVIDNVVKKILENNRYQLTWIPYNEFKNIKEIGQGYFATVYSAEWIKKTKNYSMTVIFALKKIHDQNYLDELKAYCEIGYENPSFLKCYGISRDGMGKYILVLKYAKMGSLNKNLSSIAKMRWRDKLKLLYCITSDLVAIHSQGLEHRDLHSAPEVLMNYKKFTPAADIFSLGVIMTEISTGKQAFEGLGFVPGTPDCYIRLVKRCMDSNPNKRPTAKYVNFQVGLWNEEMLSSDDNNETKRQFLEIENTLLVIDINKNLSPMSKSIDYLDISE